MDSATIRSISSLGWKRWRRMRRTTSSPCMHAILEDEGFDQWMFMQYGEPVKAILRPGWRPPIRRRQSWPGNAQISWCRAITRMCWSWWREPAASTRPGDDVRRISRTAWSLHSGCGRVGRRSPPDRRSDADPAIRIHWGRLLLRRYSHARDTGRQTGRCRLQLTGDVLYPGRELRPGTPDFPIREIAIRMPDSSGNIGCAISWRPRAMPDAFRPITRHCDDFKPGTIANYNHDGLATDICGDVHRVIEMHGSVRAGLWLQGIRGVGLRGAPLQPAGDPGRSADVRARTLL